MGAMPNYLLNIARNIIVKQIDLWTLLDIYSANNYQCIGKWIYSLCDNEDSWSIE